MLWWVFHVLGIPKPVFACVCECFRCSRVYRGIIVWLMFNLKLSKQRREHTHLWMGAYGKSLTEFTCDMRKRITTHKSSRPLWRFTSGVCAHLLCSTVTYGDIDLEAGYQRVATRFVSGLSGTLIDRQTDRESQKKCRKASEMSKDQGKKRRDTKRRGREVVLLAWKQPVYEQGYAGEGEGEKRK